MTVDQIILFFGIDDSVEPKNWHTAAVTIARMAEAAKALKDVAGREGAHRVLDKLAALAKPPRRAKSVHDARYNVELFLAYETTPLGQKKHALREVMKKHGKSVTEQVVETAIRQVRRMKQRGMTDEEFEAAPVRALLALGDAEPDK